MRIILHATNRERIEIETPFTSYQDLAMRYLDRPIKFSLADKVEIIRAIELKPETLEDVKAITRKVGDFTRRAKRIYSISEKTMERCELYNKFRITETCQGGFSPITWVHDHALIMEA